MKVVQKPKEMLHILDYIMTIALPAARRNYIVAVDAPSIEGNQEECNRRLWGPFWVVWASHVAFSLNEKFLTTEHLIMAVCSSAQPYSTGILHEIVHLETVTKNWPK